MRYVAIRYEVKTSAYLACRVKSERFSSFFFLEGDGVSVNDQCTKNVNISISLSLPLSLCLSSYGMDLNGARRKNATRETTSTLKAWLYEHRKNPYPTKGEKIMLAIITKMTLTQVRRIVVIIVVFVKFMFCFISSSFLLKTLCYLWFHSYLNVLSVKRFLLVFFHLFVFHVFVTEFLECLSSFDLLKLQFKKEF